MLTSAFYTHCFYILALQVGTVIICCWEGDELPSELDHQRMITGKATKLESQFRLSYAMILNLLRVEDLTVRIACT